MTFKLDERLNPIIPRVTARDFLVSKGLGDEDGVKVNYGKFGDSLEGGEMVAGGVGDE